jgi:hypothetical protein
MPFGQTTSAASHYQFVSNGSTKCGLLMPNHPAFCAGIASTSDATVNTSAYVPFNTVTGGFNTGGYFNTSTYLFTAPFDGVYSFTFNLFFTGSGGATYTQQAGFYVNGAFKSFTSGDAYGCCSYNATTYVGEFSCTMIYKLAAGDTVGVRPRSTNIRIYQGHCSFTGQLVG